ncbi:MAG: hypothetical protein NTX65_14940 [Ignavibacteriales bacterium]|nr:hypothetical protein [Ignavibacteriales bacterium]
MKKFLFFMLLFYSCSKPPSISPNPSLNTKKPLPQKFIAPDERIEVCKAIKLNSSRFSQYAIIALDTTDEFSLKHSFYVIDYDSVTNNWEKSINEKIEYSNLRLEVGQIAGIVDSVLVISSVEGSGAYLSYWIFGKIEGRNKKLLDSEVNPDLPRGGIYFNNGKICVAYGENIIDNYVWSGKEFIKTIPSSPQLGQIKRK